MTKWRWWLALSLASLALGCNSDDTAHLGRLGRLVGGQIERMTVDPNSKLVKGWHSLRDGCEDAGLDGRVSLRLRWEKVLAEVPIQVKATGDLVELRGMVADLSQRRRAVELAESTVGVQKVIDALELPAQGP